MGLLHRQEIPLIDACFAYTYEVLPPTIRRGIYSSYYTYLTGEVLLLYSPPRRRNCRVVPLWLMPWSNATQTPRQDGRSCRVRLG